MLSAEVLQRGGMNKLVKRLSTIGVGFAVGVAFAIDVRLAVAWVVAFAAFWVVCTGREITPPGPLPVGLVISFVLAFIGAAIFYWGLS